jgi:hypothetical protein
VGAARASGLRVMVRERTLRAADGGGSDFDGEEVGKGAR